MQEVPALSLFATSPVILKRLQITHTHTLKSKCKVRLQDIRRTCHIWLNCWMVQWWYSLTCALPAYWGLLDLQCKSRNTPRIACQSLEGPTHIVHCHTFGKDNFRVAPKHPCWRLWRKLKPPERKTMQTCTVKSIQNPHKKALGLTRSWVRALLGCSSIHRATMLQQWNSEIFYSKQKHPSDIEWKHLSLLLNESSAVC